MLVWPVRARETLATHPLPAKEPEPHAQVAVSTFCNPCRGGVRLALAPLRLAAPHRTERQIAEAAGFSRRAVYRWRTAGLTEVVADAVATSLGFHPSEIWGDAWFAGTAS